jgi:hypothetical protein
VAHLLHLGGEVVEGIGGEVLGHHLEAGDDGDALLLELLDLVGIVGEEADVLDSKGLEDQAGLIVGPGVDLVAELDVGLNGVIALILEVVSP